MKKQFECDKCTDGRIEFFSHVDNGFCYKCNGTGKLNYDPTPKGFVHEEDENRWLEEQEDMERVRQAEIENWMVANRIEGYEHL
ncbi:hypothetical protein [Fictibacillus sp. NRS-1165]|uniref:hypothetical protein n=1 Tax=Fictibacillus sp. NRS-1165 TaxID=3144463 RepID=UPI003D1EED18